MDFEDSTVILSELVSELFHSRFPREAYNPYLRESILSVYLDFAYDKTGYWTTRKVSLLMAAQFNTKSGDTPAKAMMAIIRMARKMLEVETAEYEKNNQIISLDLPEPRYSLFPFI